MLRSAVAGSIFLCLVGCANAQLPFLKDLKGVVSDECLSQSFSNPLIPFFVQCGGPLNALIPQIAQTSNMLKDSCVAQQVPCSENDIQDMLAKLQPLGDALNQYLSNVCGTPCWDSLRDVSKTCVKKVKLPVGEINPSDYLVALDMGCDLGPRGESCGVNLFKFLAVQAELQQDIGGDPCEAALTNDTCTISCSEQLTAIQTDLGCCWADAKSLWDAQALNGVAATNAKAWEVCMKVEPVEKCHGAVTTKPTPRTPVTPAAASKGDKAGDKSASKGTNDPGSDNHGGSDGGSGVSIGAFVGLGFGVFCITIFLGMTAYRRFVLDQRGLSQFPGTELCLGPSTSARGYRQQYYENDDDDDPMVQM